MDEIVKVELKKPYMHRLLNKVRSFDDVVPETKPFEILNVADLRDLKLVIIGQDPYSTGIVEFGKFHYHYDGLAFSSKNTMYTPYSLQILNKMLIKTEEYFGRTGSVSNDLYYLLDRGVLLINAIWAVRYGKPLSLAYPEWFRFTGFLLRLMQAYNESLCFLLLGKSAQSLAPYIDTRKHSVFRDAHPAASRYKSRTKLYNSDTLIRCLKTIKEPIKLLK